MMAWMRTPITWRVPFLLAFLSFAFSAQAQYSGGSGTADDPYQIATAADLIALGETPADYDKHFILTADIDLDPNLPGRKVFDKAVIAPDTNDNWDFGGTAFAGVFDGNGHTISHLTITGIGDYIALFGQLESGAEVRNLGVVDARISGINDGGGSLVGTNYGAVTQCYYAGSVSGFSNIGGLVGYNYGTMTQCHGMSTVDGMGGFVGGLVGTNGGTVTQCYSTGTVSSTGEFGGYVGGLVGSNGVSIRTGHGFSTVGTVTQCYSTAKVSGPGAVGGLAGNNSGTVTDCYSTGMVAGSALYHVGGLVGYARQTLVTGCFWDIQTSGQATSAGGVGKTTAEMQTAKTFLGAGWDFVGETKNGTDDIWWILDGQDYPRLAWERVLFDDFEDGQPGPLWMYYEPEPQRVRLAEVHGRLEVEAVAQDQDVDAIYAADGWRLDASRAFALRVDFHFAKQGTGNGRVTLGLTPSLDPSAMQWAEFEAGCFDIGPIYLYEVRDGAWVEERVAARSADSETLYMSYNPERDELYFSAAGYGKPNAWQTVTGLLKGRWAGGPVHVTLSGGSEGMTLTSGDAWLDNFTINTGVVVR